MGEQPQLVEELLRGIWQSGAKTPRGKRPHEKIAQAVGVALNTVRNVRRKCVTLGLAVAVYGQSGANSA